MSTQLPISDPAPEPAAAASGPGSRRRPSAEERRREAGRRGVAQARAALAEARLRALHESQARTAEREAALLSGRAPRRPSTHRAA